MISIYKIKNLDCPNCAKKLERSIQRMTDVKSANIVFMTQKLVVETNSDTEPYDVLQKEIKRIMPSVEIEKMS